MQPEGYGFYLQSFLYLQNESAIYSSEEKKKTRHIDNTRQSIWTRQTHTVTHTTKRVKMAHAACGPSGFPQSSGETLDLSLHQRNRRNELVSSSQKVVNSSKDDDTAIHDDTPVHGREVNRRRQREEGEDEHGTQENERPDVYGHAPGAQRPPAVR
jgi:hypothetical protein